MSLTEPITGGAASARSAGTSALAGDGRGARLRARVEALATRRNLLLLLAGGCALALVIFFVRPTYPNYDSYYTLIWGQDLADGRLPDYDVFRTPTPHPLSTVVAAGLSLIGGGADRVLVLITIASFIVLLACLFALARMLLGSLVALVALAVLLTRTDLEFFTLRAIIDVPFLALVFGAAVLELSRPRRGWPVLALLGLAGLLRPEAWVLSCVYVLWLWPAVGFRRVVGYGALAALAPALWLLSDWAVTGEPLYSLTSTRTVAGEFGRQRSVPSAVALIPDYVGGNEKIVNVIAGGLGGVLALYLLRWRAALPLALVGIGFSVFLMIAAAGLSVIPRYLLVPSLIFNLCVACAFVGWILVSEPRVRRAAIGLAVLSLLLVAWRAPAYFKDLQKLNGQTRYVSLQHRNLKRILDDERVVALLRSCGPVTVPTHSAMPVVRYETGIGKDDVRASINMRRPPGRGLLFIGRSFNFEPAAARSTAGVSQRTSQKWWSNLPLSTFRQVAANEYWRVYANCVPAPPPRSAS